MELKERELEIMWIGGSSFPGIFGNKRKRNRVNNSYM